MMLISCGEPGKMHVFVSRWTPISTRCLPSVRSVIRIRKEGLNAEARAALLQGIWPGIEDAITDGAMVTVTERSVRIRRLPIER